MIESMNSLVNEASAALVEAVNSSNGGRGIKVAISDASLSLLMQAVATLAPKPAGCKPEHEPGGKCAGQCDINCVVRQEMKRWMKRFFAPLNEGKTWKWYKFK